jgi:hypothetical protein
MSGLLTRPKNTFRPELVEGRSAWGFDKLSPKGIVTVFKGRVNRRMESGAAHLCAEVGSGEAMRRAAETVLP